MTGVRPIWGIHMEWDSLADQKAPADLAIGWDMLGDLASLSATREAFKLRFAEAYPAEKLAAVPIKAGILYRFAKEMQVGDVIVYPSKSDRIVYVGTIAGSYEFAPGISGAYPHRRTVDWQAEVPRAKISQPALYEIGSAITLFQINNNSEEFLALLKGNPLEIGELKDVDSESASDLSTQAEESVEDFIVKKLNNGLSAEQFEHFVAGLVKSMGYFTRVSRFSGDGGVDIIAHKDELGFEPPIIKIQCKQTLTTIGGPAVQQLLGAIQANEHALFVALGIYSNDAIRIERGKSNLRLINGKDLVQMILNNYENLDARFKSLLPLKRSYAPSTLQADAG